MITGGAGFIGSHIADALCREKGRVIIYDNFIRGNESNLKDVMDSGDVEVIRGDITDLQGLKKAMKGVDYVFHQAALWLLTCEENPREALRVNVEGTFNVLDACMDNGVKKLVAASSSSVYGNGIYFPTDENHPFNNDLFYGATKVADEQFMRAFHRKYGLDFVGLRYLNAYGPRMDYRSAYVMVIMNFLNKIERGEPPEIFGDGSATLDLVYVEDIARANILAMKSDITNEFFNVAGGRETTLKELLDTILELMGSDLKPVYRPRDENLVVRRYGCPKKAHEMLGFSATTTLREGLEKVIKWWREDRRG